MGRDAALEMTPEEFRAIGHALVDRLAGFLRELPQRPVTGNDPPARLRALLGDDALPQRGASAAALIERAADLVVDHSLFNGHPRFWGYITSSAAPIGALADFLAATVNPNCGAAALAPVATEIEAQTIRWIADLIGYPRNCGGLLVSGGNMANFVGFLAGRRAKSPWDVRAQGTRAGPRAIVYVSKETHTWIEKATDLFGMGTEAIRWIPTNAALEMDVPSLEAAIASDRTTGMLPLMVVGTAGSVSTGAIDPLPEIAEVCRRNDLWFHVDGAYGAPAAVLPEAPERLKALREADSVALDPHKWLYAPVEAGCVLVRDRSRLSETFAYHPPYYGFTKPDEEPPLNYHELGPQNSRGFRALKVWLGILQAGRDGYVQSIRGASGARVGTGRLEHRDVPVRPRRSRPRRRTGGLSRSAQSGDPLPRPGRRGSVRLERDRRRRVLPARVHRELPHRPRRRRGSSRDRRTARPRRGRGAAARRPAAVSLPLQ
jgi:glutamate/tyrosine decarboxylase-like PLP-dependent enzyme